MCACASKGGVVASTQNPPEPSENTDESTEGQDSLAAGAPNESLSDDPVVIDAEVVEDTTDKVEEAESSESEEIAETFPPETTVPRSKASFLPMLFGGLIAGAIGFFAAFALVPGLSIDRDAVASATRASETNASGLADLTSKIDALGAEIPEPVDTSDLDNGLAELRSEVATLSDSVTSLRDVPPVDLTGLEAQIAALGERVTALEVNEGNASSAQAAEAEEQLAAFKRELERLVADAEAKVTAADQKAAEIEAASLAAAQASERKATFSKLKAAVEGGARFTDLIEGIDDVPAALADHAKTGVPTLVVLQQDFPNAARAALATAQTVPEDASTGERLTAFLRRQTNARSLTPKEGDDPDAILSRAEALLGNGALTDALSELSALPEAAQEAMSGWMHDANTRLAALQAVDSLSAKTN